MSTGKTLRVESRAAAIVRWRVDRQQSGTETPTTDTQLGMHYADLPTSDLAPGQWIDFTWIWAAAHDYEETANYRWFTSACNDSLLAARSSSSLH